MDRDTNSRSAEPQRAGRNQPAPGLVDPNAANFPTRDSILYCTIIALALLLFLYFSTMFIPYAKQPAQLDFLPRDKSVDCADCIDKFTNVTRDDGSLDLSPPPGLGEQGSVRQTFIRLEQVSSLVEYERVFPPLFNDQFRAIHFEALQAPVTADEADTILRIGASNKPRQFIEKFIIYLRRRHTLVGWIRRNLNLWTDYDTARLRYDSFLREIEAIDLEIRNLLSRKDGPDYSSQLEADRRRLLEEQVSLRRQIDSRKQDLEDRLKSERNKLAAIRQTNSETTRRRSALENEISALSQQTKNLQSSIDGFDEETAQIDNDISLKRSSIVEKNKQIADFSSSTDQEIFAQITKEENSLKHYKEVLKILEQMIKTNDCEKDTLKKIEFITIEENTKQEFFRTDQAHNLNISGILEQSEDAARKLNKTQQEVERTIEMLKNLNLPQKITDCEAKIEDLKAKNEQAIRSRSLIANLKTEITQLENQISSLTQRKNTVAAQKADYQTRKNNIDAQIRNKQTELDGLLVNSSEEFAITDRISTLENQLNTPDPNLTRYKTVETELASISSQLVGLSNSRAEFLEKHRALIERLNSKLNEANSEKQRVSVLKNKIVVISQRWSQNLESREQLIRDFNELV